jgi:hypothetical protein
MEGGDGEIDGRLEKEKVGIESGGKGIHYLFFSAILMMRCALCAPVNRNVFFKKEKEQWKREIQTQIW